MKIERAIAVALLALGFLGLFLLREQGPVFRLAAASVGMIWVIKLAAMIWQFADGKKLSSLGATVCYFLWPGVSIKGFEQRRKEPLESTGQRFLEAWLCFLLGIAIFLTSALLGQGESLALNYLSLFSILLIVHLGLVELLADGLRLLGWSPPSLFDRPYLAHSLRDFWSVRWNRAFVDMNKIFLLEPLRNYFSPAVLVFSIFLISGVLHELGISYAAGQGWGLPLLYFLFQGIGMELERRFKFHKAFVWIWILAPLPLLFPPVFVNLFLGGLSQIIFSLFHSLSAGDFFTYALVWGGLCNLLVLTASVQVPGKLNWKEEFSRLSNMNRKVVWTYGGYIASIIFFMAVTSLLLAFDLNSLNALPGKLWLLFIALFWWARVLIDFFYMEHRDWPQGPLFTIGHICLTTLFLSLAVGYSALFFLLI